MSDTLAYIVVTLLFGIVAGLIVETIIVLLRTPSRRSSEWNPQSMIKDMSLRKKAPWVEAVQAHYLAQRYESARRLLRDIQPATPHEQALKDFFGGYVEYESGMFRDAVPYLENCLKHFMQHDRLLAAMALWELGSAYFALGRVDEAEAKYIECLRIFRKDGQKHAAIDVESNLADLYINKTDKDSLKKAAGIVSKSLRYHLLTGRIDGFADMARTGATIYIRAGRPEFGLLLARISLFVADHRKDEYRGMASRLTLGDIYYRTGFPEDAKTLWSEILVKSRQIKDLRYEGVALSRMARVDLDCDDFEGAEINAESARKAMMRIGDKVSELTSMGLLAEIALRRGENDKAERLLRRILHEAENLGIYELLPNIMDGLRVAMALTGHRNEFNETRDRIVEKYPAIAKSVQGL